MSNAGVTFKHIRAILPYGAVNKTHDIVALYKEDKNANDVIQKEGEDYNSYKERKEVAKAEFLKKEDQEYEHKVLPLIKGLKTASRRNLELLSMATYYNYKDFVIEQSRHPLTKVRISKSEPAQVNRISLLFNWKDKRFLFLNQNVGLGQIAHLEISISRFHFLKGIRKNYYLIGIYKRGVRDKKLEYFDWCTDREDEDILWLFKTMKKMALEHLSQTD